MAARRLAVTAPRQAPRSWLSASSVPVDEGDEPPLPETGDGALGGDHDKVVDKTPDDISAEATHDDSTEVHHAPESDLEKNLRPSEVTKYLDQHIVGQSNAKRSVAIAMRNRWRRRQLPKELMKEVTPRNVLMIGPTGCGKTEVARRMASLSDAPFIKVEATKFTEVGYHGRDVDQIIRDLVDVSINLTRKRQTERLREDAKKLVEERILDLLTGPASSDKGSRESFRNMLRAGQLDEQTVDVEIPDNLGDKATGQGGIVFGGDASNPNVAAMNEVISKLTSGPGGKRVSTERKEMTISEAREIILDIELDRLLQKIDLKKESIAAVEESGIVFMDEVSCCFPARVQNACTRLFQSFIRLSLSWNFAVPAVMLYPQVSSTCAW